ncbi:MAG TPA: APC family permease [bacterium]|nr:APC family permease [bacterium]
MSLADLLLGKPLASSEERAESVGPGAGIGIFGLDALSSAAYGPEAALTLLIPLGLLADGYMLPITASIIVLLSIVYFSYRQTIAAYPTGGGSFTVARANLGARAGLLAAAALMIDYVLTAAVGISAGVGALISAVPSLQRHTLALCLLMLAGITLVNLRGVRQVGSAFMLPTYVFIASLLGAIALGVAKALTSGGHPAPVVPPPAPSHAAAAAVSAWLLLQAFANGCTAMTGVEAVSNGVRAFRNPVVPTAQRTLTTIIATLILMLGGIAYLVRVYHIGATTPGTPGYESVLSLVLGAVAGKGPFYYVAMASILSVLVLSANTAFADFPRVCRAVAVTGYLPNAAALRGRRLVYSYGVYVLAALCALLLILFGGVTDRLIPLYAVGAFLAFTLSQAGMVMHWRRAGGPHARASMFVNGLGAAATAVTVAVVMVAKFAAGAWVTVLLIPALVALMLAIHRHYRRVAADVGTSAPLDVDDLKPPIVVLPIAGWDKVAQKALRFAMEMSPDIHVVHVDAGEERETLRRRWARLVEEPAERAGRPAPSLVVLPSPYRYVILPILEYVSRVEAVHSERQIVVLIPEMVEPHWYHYPLHNQRAELLRVLLLLKRNERISIVSVPWYLNT